MSRIPVTETVRLPLSELVPNPRNPRIHPEVQLEALAKSIKRFGQPKPILARRANKMICAGHGITEAMKRAGLADADVVLWNVDQGIADQFMLGDNHLPKLAREDAERVRAILEGVGVAEAEAIGFSAAALDDVLRGAAADIEIAEIAVDAVEDRFWVSVRGPLKDQAATLQRLRKVLAELPAVSVELGTVAVD